MNYTTYSIETGKIIGNVTCSYEVIPPPVEGYQNIEGEFDSATQYIAEGVVTDRPAMVVGLSKQEIAADAVDMAIISGIPSGATIRWNETEQIADGSDVEFVTDIIGEHRLHITLWPYQDAEVTINAI